MRSSTTAVRISSWSSRTSAASPSATVLLNESAARGRATIVEKGQTALYVHVDDGVVLAERGTGLADEQVQGMSEALEAVGFDVPDRQRDGDLARIVGHEPEHSPARLRLPADRGALLQDSLRHLVSLASVDIDALRSLVGVWIWAALLRRDLLSIPGVIFRFMEQFEGQVVRWWKTARREAACMATAGAAFYTDLGAPLAPVIFATDAMGAGEVDAGGYGIVAKDVEEPLARACFTLGRRPGYSVTKLSGEFTGLRRAQQPILRRVSFSRMPKRLLDAPADDWKPVAWGRWLFSDHITLGETRSVVRLCRGLAQCASAHRYKVMSLQDNGATAGACAKGWSPAPALNFLLRQRTASLVAAEVSAMLPWVQTKVMPADGLSRLL